jgi:2-dehydro-3-deoxygalactonokinase
VSEPSIVGVDWGTSSLRTALLGPDGGVQAERQSPDGILRVEGGAFASVLRRELLALDAPPGLPIVLSGMITSRQGWHERPYLACPADAGALAGALHRVAEPDLGALHFVTGLEYEGPDGLPDVMRGEETQIIGQDDLAPGEIVVLPGTHSKWVAVEQGRIMRFRTWMTGEVFAVLKAHSILGRLMQDAPADAAGFARGVAAGLDGPGLLGRLFSARTLPLTGRLAETAVADYLSGLLIGTEIGEAVAAERPSGVVVVGSDALTGRYGKALDIAGLRHRPGRSQAAARGQWRIARAAGLVR